MTDTNVRHITIGPEFFAKARNDYANYHWALIREFAQNGIDCGSDVIHWTVSEQDGKTTVVVRNDGEPMSAEILIGKLLSLGGSGKDFDGTSVGGFGKAKEILYFCWDSYKIQSGSLTVQGAGATYHESKNGYVNGTESTIVMDGLHADSLRKEFVTFCSFAQAKCVMTWNGESFEMDLRKGSVRRDLGFGKVYTNRSHDYQMVVRIGGIPMFTQHVGLNRCVVVELEGKSDEILTGNRDGLRSTQRWALSDFVTELSVDKKSALKVRQPKYRHYDGSRLCHRKARDVNVLNIVQLEEGAPTWVPGDLTLDLVGGDGGSGVAGSGGEIPVQSGHGKAAAFVQSTVETVRVAVGEEFVVKNETDLVIPTYYRPDETDFSTYAKKLTRIWGRLMVQMYRTFDVEGDFAIGFIFTDDDEMAEHEEGQFGRVYYIAPAKLVEQSGTYSKSWKKRWKLTDRNQLIMTACHEFLHGRGYGQHDEEYAGRLTDAAAKVMDCKKDFTWCFK